MLELEPYNANDYHNMGDEFIDDSKLEVVLQEKVKIPRNIQLVYSKI